MEDAVSTLPQGQCCSPRSDELKREAPSARAPKRSPRVSQHSHLLPIHGTVISRTAALPEEVPNLQCEISGRFQHFPAILREVAFATVPTERVELPESKTTGLQPAPLPLRYKSALTFEPGWPFPWRTYQPPASRAQRFLLEGVTPAGLEPAFFALKGRRDYHLLQGAMLREMDGFLPSATGPAFPG